MIHIVLFEPEIPQNTGNIMRTCTVFNMKLHLIEPLGFYMDEKHLRRSGMDYIEECEYTIHKNWEEFYEGRKGHFVYFTRYALKSFAECEFPKDDEDIYLVFGKETKGLPEELLKANPDRCVRIPMINDAAARSLNLSNSVAVGV
ncbi:MAG: tRNA (cytidine(34)-2'-O)-methyltransferase, partial [Erysipelotrichaceae bacterium]|nr:tRNA (cytidine(34)-2'-O)-methyltransferase [Erysipelotrichaceae bacterium]